MSTYYGALNKSLQESRNVEFLAKPYASVCLNTGDNALSKRHRDLYNLLLGLCAILALGDFDSKLGGCLVLKEARVIVELAPGDVFLFPLAMFTTWNITVQP